MSWRENIRKVEPYVPGEQPKGSDIVKLNTNENPYPPAPAVRRVISELADDYAVMNKYPDPKCEILINALAQDKGLKPEQVFVGVGSDDVIAMSFMTFFNSDKPVLFPDISYSFYDVWAEEFRIPYETKALKDDFTIDPEDYKAPNGGIIFPNPNAPTGLLMPLDQVEKIIAANPESVVIVDEAYIDFGGVSALPLIEKYENLLVVQTFSKSRSLAGARIGAAYGSPELIGYLNDVKFSFNSYTMNQAVLRIGAAALSDRPYFEQCCAKIIETRTESSRRLAELGFDGPESSSNFVFVKHATVPAETIFNELKKKNIYVRYFKKPRIDNYLRITIGTPEQMQRLFDALEEIL